MLPCVLAAALFFISFVLSAFALSPSEHVLAAWPLEDSEEEPLFGDEAQASDGDNCESETWVHGAGEADKFTISNDTVRSSLVSWKVDSM